MKNFKVAILFILILTTLSSCGSVKDAFSSQKKNSTDEFLVKKKSPLVMPPEFDELPLPEDINQKQENKEETDIKKLITNNENSSNENSTSQNTDFESLILEKIKNN